MPDPRRTISLLILIMFGGIFGDTPSAEAVTGNVTTLPPGPTPLKGTPTFTKLGYRVTVDTTWVHNDGYHHGDRKVNLLAGRDFVLPAGATTANTTLLVPCHEPWGRLSWTVRIDGTVDNELRHSRRTNVVSPAWLANGINSAVQSSQIVGLPHVLIVGDIATHMAPLGGLLKPLVEAEYVTIGATPQVGQAAAQGSRWQSGVATSSFVQFLATSDMPDRWLALSCFDAVCLSRQQLVTLRKAKPAALVALRRWISTGGNLWVYGIGSDWQGLRDIENSLSLPVASTRDKTAGDESGIRDGWNVPTPNADRGSVHNSNQYVGDDDNQESLLEHVDSFGKYETRDTETPSWRWRTSGDGWIAAFTADEPFQSKSDQLEWVLGTMGIRRCIWDLRYGVLHDKETSEYDFWDFVVPGVGLAPVGAFQILITLFVLVIGPINYILLRRAKRLQWLMITVPVGSVAVASSLFAYALLSDGIGTRVRARSFCELDQRLGEETATTRLSYYSGMAPSSGLTFSDQTGVYPIHLYENPWRRGQSSREHLNLFWSESKQHLTGGWLKSREPLQYFTVTAQATERNLNVQKTAGGIRVGNFLGKEIEQLVLSDGQGNLHWGEAIAIENRGQLQSIELADAQTRLRTIYNEARPKLADQIATNEYGSSQYDPYFYDGGTSLPAENYNNGWPTSRLEYRIQAAMLRLATSDESPWKGRTYVAILKETDDERLGISGAEQEASFHVIFGKW